MGILNFFVGEADRNLNYMYNNNLKNMQILLLLKTEMFKMNFIFEKNLVKGNIQKDAKETFIERYGDFGYRVRQPCSKALICNI